MREIHYTPGRIVWHELVTSDVEATRRFYGELVGWQVEPQHVPGVPPYAHLTKDGQTIGGLVQRPGPHVPPHVLAFVSVLDVEGSIARAREHRAAVLVPPMPTAFGRGAVVQDPQGAVIGLCRRTHGDPIDHGRAQLAGRFCWSMLRSSDAENAASFYGKVMAWDRTRDARVKGLCAFSQGGRAVAGLMQAPQGTFAHWLVHISVDSLERARPIAKQLGGTIVVERTALDGIGQLSIIQDNVGAIVALLEAQSGD